MKQNLAQITVVLDRSGSMGVVRDETIKGFNEFVDGQKFAVGEANLTLVQFDIENAYEVLFDSRPIKDVPKLTAETYVPRGGTPLNDAVGRAIDALGAKLGGVSESERPGKVIFVIVTDGQENSSKEYTAARVKDMVKHQKENYNWQFVFLGANLEAFQGGAQIGMPISTRAVYFDKNFGAVMAATSSKLASYRSTSNVADLEYTEEERKEAVKGATR
jgi:hypothetical protein